MNPDVRTTLISAVPRLVSTAVVALALNHRGFTIENRITSLDNRMTGLETRIDNRFTTMENRLHRRLEKQRVRSKGIR
jgi:hypothetical protein